MLQQEPPVAEGILATALASLKSIAILIEILCLKGVQDVQDGVRGESGQEGEDAQGWYREGH